MKQGIFLKIPKVQKCQFDGMTLEQLKKLYDDEMSTIDRDLNWIEMEKLKRLIDEQESK